MTLQDIFWFVVVPSIKCKRIVKEPCY